MKKIISALMALTMVFSTAINCFAQTYDPSVIRSTYTLNHTYYTFDGANEKNVYAITDDKAYKGKKSVHIIHSSGDDSSLKMYIKPGGSTLNLGKTDINNWSSANLTGATHTTIAFYADREIDTSGIKALVMVSNGQTFLSKNNAWKKSEWPQIADDGKEWYYYYSEQVTYNVAGQINDTMNRVYIEFTGDCDFYLDNIAWNYTNDGGTYDWEGNLLKDKDNSFEDTGALLKKDSEEKQYARNLIYDWASGAVQLTWKNPACDNIESIKVLDENDTDITSDAAFDTGSQALNKFDIANLNNNEKYTFKVAVSIDGQTYKKSIDVIPRATRNYDTKTVNGYPIMDGKWKVNYGDSSTTGYKANVSINYRADEGVSNKGCMEIVSNNLWKDNQFVHLDYAISGLDSSSKYTLSFKGKAFEADNFFIYPDLNTNNAQGFNYKINVGQSGYLVSDDGWKDYEITMTPKANAANLRLTIRNSISSFLMDDIKLVKEGTSNNLIKNGGFDFEVKSATFDAESKTVSWTLPEGNAPWDTYRIYKAGNAEAIAEIETENITNNSYVLAEAEKDDVYFVKTYFIGAGWESKGVATATYAIATPRFDQVDFNNNEFSSVGENAEIKYENIGKGDLLPGDNVMSTISVQNITENNPIDLLYVTALYSNDSELIKCICVNANVKIGESATYKSVIAVPETEGKNYSVKSFVWNGKSFQPFKSVMITDEYQD